MREFIKQSEVVDEFVKFLGDKSLTCQYNRLIGERIAVSDKNLPQNVAYRNSNGIEEYLHKTNDNKRIIDIEMSSSTMYYETLIDSSMDNNIIHINNINNDFGIYFNDKYNDKIQDALDCGRKMLVRFIKEKYMKYFIEYDGMTKYELRKQIFSVSGEMPLYWSVPFTVVIPFFNEMPYTEELVKFRDEFSAYYTNNIAI